ncbi:hypothetical protein ES703_70765 [subsurface metagenome]
MLIESLILDGDKSILKMLRDLGKGDYFSSLPEKFSYNFSILRIHSGDHTGLVVFQLLNLREVKKSSNEIACPYSYSYKEKYQNRIEKNSSFKHEFHQKLIHWVTTTIPVIMSILPRRFNSIVLKILYSRWQDGQEIPRDASLSPHSRLREAYLPFWIKLI